MEFELGFTMKFISENNFYHQRTLAKSVSCSGIGVHSGRKVRLNIHPASINHGIKFKRIDLSDGRSIPALFSRVVDTSLATVIGQDGCIVSTIEHLMATFSGLSIDNALVELDSYELPIMDGSAGPFTKLIKSAGIKNQNAPRFFFMAKEPIILEGNGKSVSIYPGSERRITYTIAFNHPLVQTQSFSINLSADEFENEIAPARTFGFYDEIEYLKKFGLARGGSLDNAIVLDREKILNPGGLRYPDEFVRHKILDCIGDFSLLGMPIMGHIKIFKSGHQFNHEFLKEFLTRKGSWETCSLQ
jgi:UDP-3-O-[3-hydroxymyristoyl] N-acetylglucosamine deacetylase